MLCEFDVRDSGRIEDRPEVFIQTDFANEYIGGGVLNTGRVQVCLYLFCLSRVLLACLYVYLHNGCSAKFC